MDDDLDTPRAMAVLFDAVRDANKSGDASVAAAALEIAGALGIEFAGDAGEVPAEITGLASERDAARASKDFAEADRLRDEIVAAGYVVEDSPSGTVVRAR